MSSAEGTAGTGTEGAGTEGTSTTDGKDSSGTTSTADGFKPPASQADFDRIIADRIARERAKFADTPELRKKAAEYDKLVEAQKNELQKTQDRAEAAEKRAADLEAADAKRKADAEAAAKIGEWKTKIAESTGVPASALRGSTEDELREHAKELKALIPERKGGGYVPAEGRAVGSGGADPRTLFAEIIKNA